MDFFNLFLFTIASLIPQIIVGIVGLCVIIIVIYVVLELID